MLRNPPIHIALFPQGGSHWIAGVIYMHNIIRALRVLPESERPTLHYILPAGTTITNLQELDADPPIVHYYAYKRATPLRRKFGSLRQSITALQWPRSLENTVVRTHAKALFPLQGSLGKTFPVPWIGWIPDFQHKHLPHFFSENERENRDNNFRTLIDEASHIVVSSWDSHKDLMHWYSIDSTKASVFQFASMATPQWYQDHPRPVAQRYGVPEKYIIFPSQFWVHKNHPILFEALRILRDSGMTDVSLVLTGHTHDYRWPRYYDTLEKFIHQHGLTNQIHIMGLLDRQNQIQLVRCAAAVIQPSLFEGWSSLVEDCRTLGKKIYLSDLPVHREQNPPDAEYFDPSRPQEIAELIARDWSNLSPGPDLKGEQIAYSQHLVRAKTFAKTFLDIVERASRC